MRKISVAVLLDKNAPPVDETQIKNLISNAVGLDAKRGDTISVSRPPFDTSAATAASKAAAKASAQVAVKRKAALLSMVKTGGAVLLVVIVVVVDLDRQQAPQEVGTG